MKCQGSNKEDSSLIKVRNSTDKGKYELLRSYYTSWNKITKVRHRVIIDTHAGSGMVQFLGGKNILNKRVEERRYGSPLLAILKTLKMSNKLKIIFNEADPARYSILERHVQDFIDNGIPVFISKKKDFRYKSLQTKRKRKQKGKQDWKFPESPGKQPMKGYNAERIHSKAEIIMYNHKIEELIEEIFNKHLKNIEEKDKSIKPIALFFVDPCGVVGWNDVIKKICQRSNKQEGTELILNWSYEAIARTINTESKNTTLSKMYGIPLEDIDKEFEGITEMEQYLNKYLGQLKNYFEYVINYGVPRDRKIKPKLSDYRKYFLIVCTNNSSGASLAGYKAKEIKQKLRGYKDMDTFLKQ